MNFLFAQVTGSSKNYPGDNINVNKTEFQVHQNFINNGFSGTNEKINTTVIVDEQGKLLISVLKANLNIKKKESIKLSLLNFFGLGSSGKSHQKPEKNLITSFPENIDIVGISGEFAVIRFTPKLNIKPVEFINISANQDVRYLIPIKTAGQHLQLFIIQSTYILAIDNFMNLLSKTQTITHSIAGFIAKNIITSLINEFIDNNSKYKTYSLTTYNYSIKIKL